MVDLAGDGALEVHHQRVGEGEGGLSSLGGRELGRDLHLLAREEHREPAPGERVLGDDGSAEAEHRVYLIVGRASRADGPPRSSGAMARFGSRR